MNNFEQNIINIYKDKGREWLDNLPKLVQAISSRLGLSQLEPVKNLSYNYILSGWKEELPIVLKLGLDVESLNREADALRALRGYGGVNLIIAQDGILMLQRAVPGNTLKSTFPNSEGHAIQIVCGLIKRLHQAPIMKNNFLHIRDWLEVLDNKLDLPNKYLQQARYLKDQLLKTSNKEVLLHGDLHHDNIISNGDEWLVIDPKAVIGEPAFEVAAFIRNPIPELLERDDCFEIIKTRINYFAELLNLDAQRINDWSFVQACLGWAWELEDGGDPKYFKKLTKMIYSSYFKG
jgi:streptomycin 6-kinase